MLSRTLKVQMSNTELFAMIMVSQVIALVILQQMFGIWPYIILYLFGIAAVVVGLWWLHTWGDR